MMYDEAGSTRTVDESRGVVGCGAQHVLTVMTSAEVISNHPLSVFLSTLVSNLLPSCPSLHSRAFSPTADSMCTTARSPHATTVSFQIWVSV